MTERYSAKIVKVVDDYTIVVNRGIDGGLKVGDQFVVVCLGEVILDPDTNEDLGKLEIVKGKAEVVHVQDKMATLKSCRYSRAPEKKDIKKVTSSGKGGLISMFGAQDTVTESITPGESILLKLENPVLGDALIKA
jgi:hypothetical protein